jgi:hypothetical protein
MKKVFAVVLILAGYAIGQAIKAPAKASAETSMPQSGHVGRYQIFFSPHARADVYLVDTETGQIWKPVTITNAKDTNMKSAAPEVWLYQDRINNATEFNVWMAFHQATPAATPPQ